MEKTLGGDRLGSGKKMKVELHNYERSTHDIGYIWRSTMSAGTLVPFLCELATPGTTFDINIGADIKTHPTIGPLFGSYKVQIDTFLVPIRLYNSALHNNMLNVGRQMSTVKIPQIEYTALTFENETITGDIDNCQVNPSALPAYLGVRGIGWPANEEATRQFNAIPTLAYWEIYKNYYANKQEEIGAVIHNTNVQVNAAIVTTLAFTNVGTAPQAITKVPPGAVQSWMLREGVYLTWDYTGFPRPTEEQQRGIYLITDRGNISLWDVVDTWVDTATANTMVGLVDSKYLPMVVQGWNVANVYDAKFVKPKVSTFALSNIDEMRKKILLTDGQTVFTVNSANLEPYKWLYEQPNGVPNILSSQEGLALKTYNSDLFNNWLKTENIEAISTSTAVDTSGGNFTIDALVISKKVWAMLNRIEVSGGSYDDWMDAVYVHERYRSQESPMYQGGLIKELVFQEVVSNSESQSGQPLGTLAGKGTMSSKHKGGTVIINVDEPSYIIGLISLTPRIDYSQGNKWDVHLKTMDDLHKPPLDQIGFQDLIVEQMAWWTTTANVTDEWSQISAGKQPAWLNYMTNVNQVRGNFAIKDSEMFMTLNRRYEPDPTLNDPQIIDLTTYIDPSKFNFIFAETALDAQNFWAQIAIDITARRKMSGKLMPNL